MAIALAHFEKERRRAELEIESLRDKLMSVSLKQLLDGLLGSAKQDPSVLSALKQICEAGQSQ